jgi:Tfp pilus assembly protein PilO
MFNDKARLWYLGAAVTSILVLVAGWFLLVSPQHDTADELTTQAESVEAANVATTAQIASLKAQYKDLPALEQQLAAMRQRIPNTANMPSVIRSISTSASKSGVALTEFTPGGPAPLVVDAQDSASLQAPGQVNMYPVSLTFSGRFANVRLFLNSLEGQQRSFLVTGVEIKRTEANGSTEVAPGTLDVTVTGRVFTANPGMPTVKKPAATDTTAASTTPAS